MRQHPEAQHPDHPWQAAHLRQADPRQSEVLHRHTENRRCPQDHQRQDTPEVLQEATQEDLPETTPDTKHREAVHHTDQATAEAARQALQATAEVRQQQAVTAVEVHRHPAAAATAEAHRVEVTEDKKIT